MLPVFLKKAFHRLPALTGLVSILFSLNACAGMAPRPAVKANPISASEQQTAYVKEMGWLDTGCNLVFKYDNQRNLKLCVRVEASLMEPYDPARKNTFSKDYDPEKYYQCRSRFKTSAKQDCNKYKNRRNTPDPVWPYPHAPAINWPEPPARAIYKPGMHRADYFKELCEKESGYFVYRTVDNVKGVYQVRPRLSEAMSHMHDPYLMEDPYGFNGREGYRPWSQTLNVGPYQFAETSLADPWNRYNKVYVPKMHTSFAKPVNEETRFYRFTRSGEDNYLKSIKLEHIKELKSRYGYVYRGIDRPMDREQGIAGGEIAFIDLQTNEVLGLIRGFAISGFDKTYRVSWLNAIRCANAGDTSIRSFDRFLTHVFKPAPLPESAELLKGKN